MASSNSIDRLARHVKRTDQPAWLPRTPRVSLHQGVLADVDLGRNTVQFAFNDPSGLILPGVRYLQAYSDTNQPRAGDVVWAQHFGTDLMILGRHVVPTSTVTL